MQNKNPISLKYKAFLTMLAAALFASCTNLVTRTPQDLIGGGYGQGENSARGTLTVTARVSGDASRYAMPSAGVSDFVYAALLYHGTSPKEEKFEPGTITTDDDGSTRLTFSFQRPDEESGLTLEVFAFKADTAAADFSRGNAILSGSETGLSVTGETIAVDNPIALSSNKPGSVRLKIKVPEGCSLAISDTRFSVAPDSGESDSNTYIVSASGISAGAHQVTFALTKGGQVVYTFTEHINVLNGLCTDTWGEGATKTITQSAISSTVYVRGAGGWYDNTSPYNVGETAVADDANLGSFSSPLATIQKAVETVIARNDGSAYTIYIDGTLDGMTAPYLGDKGMADFSKLDENKNLTLTIKALSGTATLDANQKSRVINASPASGALNLTLENLIITGGNTTEDGGGMLVANNGTVTMSGGTITGNTAQYGGGVYNRGTFTMEDGTISGNTAAQDGGGVYVYGGTFTMKDGTIGGTNTANYGGGVYVKDGGTFTMKKGSISGNTARGKVNDSGKLDGGGGGVYLFGSEFTMSGGTITGNKVTNGNAEGSGGGGIYLFDSATFTMTGGTVSGNTAANSQGKGAFISPGCTFNMSGAAQFADTDDVYLYVYTGATLPTITVAGSLSKTKVATITPSNYIGGTPVLTKGGSTAAITQAICGKFALSEEVWKIVPDSTGTNGVLMTTTVYVASTGSDTTGNGTEARPFATIQKAVDTVLAMNDGTSAYTIYIDGTLQCDDSTYVGAKGMADFSALAKNLTLTIKALSGTATLDGGARLTASGSVTNAGIKKSIIYAKPTSGTLNLTLENLVIMGGNYSGGSGGGIYFKGKTLEMTGCTISGCTSSYGGGVCVDAGTFTMTGCTISGCTASRGGGVYNSGTFTIDGCTISDCTATLYGGGVYNSGMFTMNSGTITGNTASNGGGVQNSGTFTMNNGEISRNTVAGSDSTGNGGGGVYVSSGGTFTMRGGTITGNTASNNGGGVHVDDLATFTNTGGTITGNTAGTNGGGVYVFGSRATFTNTGGTISGNTPDDVYPAS